MRMYAPAWQGLNPAAVLRRPLERELPFPLGAAHATFFYRARNAIYHLARELRLDRRAAVLVPDYHHGNEVAALRAAGATVRFYPIRRNLEPDLDALSRICRDGAAALFVIHYLGWPQPLDEMEELCRRHGLILIEDCALALLSQPGGSPLGSRGDYAVFCLYKTLPLPNGGLLVQNRGILPRLLSPPLRPCRPASVAGRCSELSLEWLRGRLAPVGSVLSVAKRTAGLTLSALGVRREPVGDSGFSLEDADLAMSPLCRTLIPKLDHDAIRRKRRANFELMRRCLGPRASLPREDLPDGVCPLFFPLLVEDKAAASDRLLRRGIGNVQFWNHGDPEAGARMSSDVRLLRERLLELPIHQELTPSQVVYIAQQVRALGLAT